MNSLLLINMFSDGQAFCGTYVGGAGSEYFNEYAQVAVVRQGTQSTLTIMNDIQTDSQEVGSFALVVPVPEVITADTANVLESDVFDRLDAYSQPRLVRYECSDFEYEDQEMWQDGGSSTGGDPTAGGGGVEIEAHFVEGEYEIFVVSATGSEGLYTWLNDNSFYVPAQSQDLLQTYIDQGLYFMAAKVSEASLSNFGIESGSTLSPLQITYNSSAFQIPIRIGTLNSKSAQDVVVYVINDYNLGYAAISNYREFSFEDECMWESDGEEFGYFVSHQFTEAYEEEDSAGWMLEYAWGGGGCDPCSGTPPPQEDLVSLGLDSELVHYGQYYFSRLHARYTPQQATEELMLYHTNIFEQSQIRYIEYEPYLEDRFPVCGIGMVDDPQTCDDVDGEPSSEIPNTEEQQEDKVSEDKVSEEDDTGKGCQSIPWEPTLLIFFIPLLYRRST